MRAVNRLTARAVATLKQEGYHADGQGLYLIVDDQGAKRWAFIFQWNTKRKEMGLGPLSLVSLAEARVKRDDARRMVASGRNPIDERKRKAGATFGEVASDLIDEMKKGWRGEKTEDGWRNTLDVHAVALKDKPPAAITTEDVLNVLSPIWAELPETAQKLRGRIETVLDAAAVKGLRSGENPARWKGHLALMLAKPQKLSRGHHAALPYSDVPNFMQALSKRHALGARALEFTILTVARTDEALSGSWPEVDLAPKLWTIPGERMKGGKEHRVPLTDPAIRSLGEPGEGWLFPGWRAGRPLSGMAMQMVLRRMGRDDITVHGFRSTFRDWAGDKTDFPEEIVEQALAHTVGSTVRRAYRRQDALDRRRELMEAWAAYCYPAF